MHLQSNPQLELAFEFVYNTDKNIFLTGKAGTGKTTFLQQLKHNPVKRMAVVAPTGVAAINAGGMTIHSFFQLPFGPYLPGSRQEVNQQRRFSRDKIRLIQSLDLLVIDEISMVRADLLDGIDDVLRRYKDHYKPFGGVQMLMIGDLHQLPPVVRDEDWHMLRSVYDTPFFFSSQAWKQTEPVAIELKHIYRQSDSLFIDLLNKVRDNRMSADVLELLNSRYIADFQPPAAQPYITLTAHNAAANEINAGKLTSLSTAPRVFKAAIVGEFPLQAYPTDEALELKEGAQVMFVRNDLAREKRYYNGKIGKLTRIAGDTIYVQCPDDAEEIAVLATDWENIKYHLNETTKEVTEEVVGTFTQYPLRLAWAITIHKSQGLTFERAIIDAQAAFAHGQVYVALSRCKSFEGIVLRSKIEYSSVRTDSTVKDFTEAADRNTPDEARLFHSKRAFQQSQIRELFDFTALKRRFDQLNRVILEHESSLLPDLRTQFLALRSEANAHVFKTADAFNAHLQAYFTDPGLPETNEILQERIRKAGEWFAGNMKETLLPACNGIPITTDNKAVRKAAVEALENLQKEMFVKHACFKAVMDGFSTHAYLRTRANAELDFQATKQAPAPQASVPPAPAGVTHPRLYALLKDWRDGTASDLNQEPYMVLPTKSLVELVQVLPVNMSALKKVKGIGAMKSAQFGAEILEIIRAYCATYQIDTSDLLLAAAVPVAEKVPKPDTKSVSLDLLKSGKTIDEIAAERGMVRSTIEGHLGHYVGLGELDIYDLLEDETVDTLEMYFWENGNGSSAAAREHFGDRFSYGEIKLVLKHMEYKYSTKS